MIGFIPSTLRRCRYLGYEPFDRFGEGPLGRLVILDSLDEVIGLLLLNFTGLVTLDLTKWWGFAEVVRGRE